MAVAVRASSKVTWSTGDGTLTKPTGTVDGDLILIFVGGDLAASENHTYLITGFATLCTLTRSSASGAGTDLIVFWKIASGEGASWVVDIDSDNLTQAVAISLTGHDSADPFDVTQITGYDDATEAKIPSATTTVVNTLAIGGVTWDASKTLTTVPANWTQIEHADVSGADLHTIQRAYAATGATGVAQYDVSAAAPHVGAVVVVQPPQKSAALTGTVTASITEADIVAGGKTIILTLTGDTWIAAGAGSFDLQRQAIINGIDSAQSETFGWDLVPKALQGVAGVVRTSDTVVTITLDAFSTYNITAQETITATIPAAALTGAAALVASPAFTIATSGGVVTVGNDWPIFTSKKFWQPRYS